ncbi:MAG TPA: hypothetical protein VMA13_09855 [Candidatus Saccharimonadales bacterium]|nr:hypothetical protein [Candidatus Saccharimonadales bacterium]
MSLGLIIFSRNASGQNFEDLNFEQANIVRDPSDTNAVYVSEAIPGWTVSNSYHGTNEIDYEVLSLGAPSVSLCGSEPAQNGLNPAPPPLDGKFSIELYGGAPEMYPLLGASISQTAMVPAHAESILFIAQQTLTGGPLLVSLGGQNISYSAISKGPDYTLYGGDIPAFAGQVETLTFNAPTGVNNYWELDDIRFSSSPVPEPRTFSLCALGGLFFTLGLRGESRMRQSQINRQ